MLEVLLLIVPGSQNMQYISVKMVSIVASCFSYSVTYPPSFATNAYFDLTECRHTKTAKY